jgi:hypothetical protein
MLEVASGAPKSTITITASGTAAFAPAPPAAGCASPPERSMAPMKRVISCSASARARALGHQVLGRLD